MYVSGENTYTNGNLTKATGKVSWGIRDDRKINKNEWMVEDGDFLEVYDNSGRILFSKHIIEDYDSHYNPSLKRQVYRGTTVGWLPHGVDAGFWFNMFNNRFRARLVKKDDQE